MDNCSVVAATWRYASADEIARYTLPLEDRPSQVRRLRRRIGAKGLIYLATCNRAAFILAAERGATLASCRRELLRAVAGESAARRVFRSWEGEGAVEHLYLVAAGLDSARPGEREIRGQLRAALDDAKTWGTLDPGLCRVVESALRAGKRVHRETGIGAGRTSLAEIAADVLRARVADAPGPVALVGVSTMTETCAERLHARGIPLVLVNRTEARAAALAEQTNGSPNGSSNGALTIGTMALDEFRRKPPAVTAALFATHAPGAVVDRRALAALAGAGRDELGTPPLVIDMAIPADAPSDDANAAGLERIDMDRINELAQQTLDDRRERTAQARVLIDRELDAYREDVATRSVAGAIRRIDAQYRNSLTSSLDRLLQGDLRSLSGHERDTLRDWTSIMAKRLSHLPVLGLRAVATEIGEDGVDAFVDAGLGTAGGSAPTPSSPQAPRTAPPASTASPTSPDRLLLRALRGDDTPRRPLWIMRQAGRILPEYRALKERHGFLGLSRDPELAAEVTLLPLRRFPFDAAITFADIMSPLPALGVDFRFDPGPVIAEPITGPRQIDALPDPDELDDEAIAPEVAATQRIVRAELDEETALLGFAGAPLTLAAYLIQGRGVRDFPKLRAFANQEPAAFDALLDRLARLSARYLVGQHRAGADAVQVFDSWAGLFEQDEWRRRVRPHLKSLLDRLGEAGVPRILYLHSAPQLVDDYADLPCEALGVDWRTDLGELRTRRPGLCLQGNLDPAILLAGKEAIQREATSLLGRLPRRGHIVNLGHGVLPTTPLDAVQTLVEAVHAEAGADAG